ncbi:UBA/Ts-N domain-containing protein [Coriobacterium glomerans PW2]|uniref:UBA/Ts-N domain-containing protein n=2 Tax=Coriobacterium TaxID=33870 RepID=F2NAW5_CORGP|nr:UBA/Ts-N domain-containing protein [Coriobacterium glomerans PW2]
MQETQNNKMQVANQDNACSDVDSGHRGSAGSISEEERLRRTGLVRENAGVSFEDARAALELTSYDMIDAVILLERQGKTSSSTVHISTGGAGDAAASSSETARQMSQAQIDYERDTRQGRFEERLGGAMRWVRHVLQRSIDITLVAKHRGRQVFSMPLLLVLLLAASMFWTGVAFQFIVVLLIASLFFDFRYHFECLEDAPARPGDVSDDDADEDDDMNRKDV